MFNSVRNSFKLINDRFSIRFSSKKILTAHESDFDDLPGLVMFAYTLTLLPKTK